MSGTVLRVERDDSAALLDLEAARFIHIGGDARRDGRGRPFSVSSCFLDLGEACGFTRLPLETQDNGDASADVEVRDEAARDHGAACVTLLDLGEARAQRATRRFLGVTFIDEHEGATIAHAARPCTQRGLPRFVIDDIDADHRGARAARDPRTPTR